MKTKEVKANEVVANEVIANEVANEPVNANPAKRSLKLSDVVNSAPEKSTKLSDEELQALYEECKANQYHKVSVVPFGDWEWVDGYIHSVTKETRARKVFYDIRTVDGRTVRKVYNAKGLKINEETTEPTTKRRTTSGGTRELWDENKWDEIIRDYVMAIGRWIPINESFGRIISLVPDKRVNMLLLRIELVQEDGTKKIAHLSHNKLKWEELQADDESEALAAAWLERYEKRLSAAPKEHLSKKEKLVAQIEKLQNKLAELTAQLEELKDEDGNKASEADNNEANEADNNEELM